VSCWWVRSGSSQATRCSPWPARLSVEVATRWGSLWQSSPGASPCLAHSTHACQQPLRALAGAVAADLCVRTGCGVCRLLQSWPTAALCVRCALPQSFVLTGLVSPAAGAGLGAGHPAQLGALGSGPPCPAGHPGELGAGPPAQPGTGPEAGSPGEPQHWASSSHSLDCCETGAGGARAVPRSRFGSSAAFSRNHHIAPTQRYDQGFIPNCTSYNCTAFLFFNVS